MALDQVRGRCGEYFSQWYGLLDVSMTVIT